MRAALLLGLVLTLTAATAFAHPYLAEEAVDIGNERSLPWNGQTDFGLVADYDVRARLVPDTLALLSPTKRPLVRFETLRRAALYLSPRFATPEVALPLRVQLARRLAERVDRADSVPRLRALAQLDAGCFETLCARDRTLSSGRDGYGIAKEALPELPEAVAEVEYVLGRLATDWRVSAAHSAAGLRGAADGTLLARNILRDWEHEFATLAELRQGVERLRERDDRMPGFPQPPPVPGADPAVRHEVVLLAPAALSVRKADDGAFAVGWVKADPVPIRISVGHRMVVGTRVDESVWVGEKRLSAHDTEGLLSGEPLGAVSSASFLPELPAASADVPVTLRAVLAVFETDIPPQHMWSPTGGRYRVLWERTYEARLR